MLLNELTPAEKLTVLSQGPVPRLHVISDGFNEALHGVAWAGRATVFPCPMAMASTWNATLVREIGKRVAYEALAKHWGKDHSNALSFFAPNINIVRDIRWGRAQETYGEDPTLTGTLGAAYVSGMQDPRPGDWPSPAVRNVAKHFAAYNLESDYAGRSSPASIARGDGQYRLSYDANVSRADLLQTYLLAWEDIVQQGKIRGVMCAYNSVNGTPLCASELLETELRVRIGFEGIVISDCGAIGFMTSEHHWHQSNGTEYSPMQAAAASLRAGTDLNCGGAFPAQLAPALQAGLVTMHQVDLAVQRALFGHMELGLYQDTAAGKKDPRRQVPMSVVDSPEHRALAQQAAREAVVLLKNERGFHFLTLTLTLTLTLSSLSPLTQTQIEQGSLPLGGVGMARGMASVAAAVSGKSGRGGGPIRLAVVGPNANRTMTLTSNYAGCKDSAGGPILPTCTFVNPLQGIQAQATVSDLFASEVAFAPGVDIDTNSTAGIAAAVSAASEADVTIVVAGLITCQETGAECQEAEARDRSTPVNADGTLNSSSTAGIGYDYGIGLPGKQQVLLEAIAAKTNTTIVLVLLSGSAVATPWAARSPRIGAILQLFYPGVLGGAALAEVLFGQAAPSGRLPVMIPESELQLPRDYLDQSMEAGPGRTHRYFTGKPLFSTPITIRQ